MRALLTLLLRLGRSKSDASALLGDLEEEYRARVRSGGGWLRVRAWYAREVVAAVAWGTGDRLKGRAESHPDKGARRSSVSRLLDPADVRLALRRWRRRPGVAIATVLTLALGGGPRIGDASSAFASRSAPRPPRSARWSSRMSC